MSNIKLSYGITVCNELEEVKRLVNFLLSHKRKEDEIVILFDQSGGTQEVLNYLDTIKSKVQLRSDFFEGHFADWKNKLNSCCNGDYIVQYDADELPNQELINNLPHILEANPELDVLLVPRVNTVEGLTQKHIEKWGWGVTKLESPNLIQEKEVDTESEEYRLLKEGGFIIEEHSISI